MGPFHGYGTFMSGSARKPVDAQRYAQLASILAAGAVHTGNEY